MNQHRFIINRIAKTSSSMSIRLAVTYMFLVTTNLGRQCIAFRSCANRLSFPSNTVRSTSSFSFGHYTSAAKLTKYKCTPSMILHGELAGGYSAEFSSSVRDEIIDEAEEIPLSEEEKIAKELNEEDDDDDLDIDSDDGDDNTSNNVANSFSEGSLRLKVRQHVNPLASRYLVPMEGGEEWVAEAFANTSLPVVVDIGCAKGSWVLKYGAENPSMNIVGLEIRRPVVEFALQRKKKWGLTNVHFLSVNANIDLNRILKNLISTGGSIDMVTIQFPDPHFKRKHKKRRVVNELLVNTIVSHLEIGKMIFVQSDILDVTEDMIMNFSNNEQLEMVEGYDPVNLSENISPNNVLTEREVATQKKELPVYRMMFRKFK